MSDTVNPAVIRRADYAAPAFLIDSVALEFDLAPERTIVKNTMRMRRNADAGAAPGASSARLELMGEGLEFIGAAIDGKALSASAVRTHEHGLTIDDVPDTFTLAIESACNPGANTTLSGLYVSSGNFFTQCEAEGFRRITYFLDRPDVMATYTVVAARGQSGVPGPALERQPHRGRRAARRPPLREMGRPVQEAELSVRARRGPAGVARRTHPHGLRQGKTAAGMGASRMTSTRPRHAMDSLIHSIRWDEERFGLELDLDRFMIVAVSDFNMGAMENKGLNIFNTKYVLANPETATDTDFGNIEAVVGHEYFHNWTGNRVTCRDWFQLSLKEGLTVFRDQEFSADMQGGATDEAARAVKRIEDVRVLRQMQFPEDAGPMAHPVRPESYVEINNFYTMTVYEKGAEVVRMYQTLVGREGFRRGMDLYFERHDGQAVTCDDFRHAMADANGARL